MCVLCSQVCCLCNLSDAVDGAEVSGREQSHWLLLGVEITSV